LDNLADIVGIALSVMVKKSRQQTTVEEDLQRLHQLLLRISAMVDGAAVRCVTNRRMIRQVSMMTKQMLRGYTFLTPSSA
jgi:acetolactate synthase small subunit